MTLRHIQWIADCGLLVGLTTIGEFAPPPMLRPLSLSATDFVLATPVTGAILGATTGSIITVAALPAGLTITAAPGWSYDGSGTVGSYTLYLTETLSGGANSPNSTGIAVAIAPPATLDFSQSVNSGLIAALRSF